MKAAYWAALALFVAGCERAPVVGETAQSPAGMQSKFLGRASAYCELYRVEIEPGVVRYLTTNSSCRLAQ